MNNESFLGRGYKVPISSNYMKLVEGKNKFRALSNAVTGFEYFSKDNKPIRQKEEFEEMPTDIKAGAKVKHFWAFIVWNYEAERIQILEIGQKSIIEQLKNYIDDSEWGNPQDYDITITRKGTSLNDTEYFVSPNPHKELDPVIAERYKKSSINLEALFDGRDPFTVEYPENTSGNPAF